MSIPPSSPSPQRGLPEKIVLASGNKGKLREIHQMLDGLGAQVLPQSDFKLNDADETGLSFVENAIIKARHAALATGLPAIADDSGLEVDALNGAPGIYSARFSGPHATDAENVQKLLTALQGRPDHERRARFQCLMVYMAHAEDPTPLICQGTWEGQILQQRSGDNGFGYDPVFFVPSEDCAAAELPPAVKNRLSHRGQALGKLLAMLQQKYS